MIVFRNCVVKIRNLKNLYDPSYNHVDSPYLIVATIRKEYLLGSYLTHDIRDAYDVRDVLDVHDFHGIQGDHVGYYFGTCCPFHAFSSVLGQSVHFNLMANLVFIFKMTLHINFSYCFEGKNNLIYTSH